jgi:hypothetical protein
MYPKKYELSSQYNLHHRCCPLFQIGQSGVIFSLDNLIGELLDLPHQQRFGRVRREVHRFVMSKPQEEGHKPRPADLIRKVRLPWHRA